jgi:DNA-binding CsgD family transcriptional regulator
MAASGLLRERDLRALTAVIEDGLRDDPGPAMPWTVLDRLQQLIPSNLIQFGEHDLRGPWNLTSQLTLDGGDHIIEFDNLNGVDDEAHFWELRHKFLPSTYAARTGDVSSVVRWSDFYTGAELKNTPFYAEYGNPRLKYCMYVPLPGLGRTRNVGFWRSNRDFSERDRLALQLLRPHLHELWVDAERRRRGTPPRLSRREREVLQLAAQGCSNADIARILFISPATVAKHMEHIFDRTGVRTRSAAAALALPSPLSLRPLHGK